MVEKLFDFIKKSPTAFHAVARSAEILDKAGFTELDESKKWKLEKGGKYYVKRHGSALVAFKAGEDFSFNIVASHTDSPTFRIKTSPVMKGEEAKLNVEAYGGAIYNTWLDRPLGIAGRVVLRRGDELEVRNVISDKTVVIPNLAVHLNRTVNDGVKYNPQVDMCPVVGGVEKIEDILPVSDEIAGYDLMLFCKDEGFVWGDKEQYVCCPRLDDLEGCFCALEGLLASEERAVNVLALLDSEEIGSSTYTGANSDFLSSVLGKIGEGLGKSANDVARAYSNSTLVSLDNAHGVHPNHKDLNDPTNKCYLNNGVVIKHHSSSYTTDAVSGAIIKSVFDRAEVPYQDFYNRSDLRGGSTLGAISLAHVGINSVDIGLAQWAMHSAVESAGVKDIADLIKGLTEFYSVKFSKSGEKITIK